MATTLTKLPYVRRVVRGISGPQPLAGTPQRAADAYAAMRAADWAESDDGPAIPPHDYDADAPASGDAYRQTWGYDAEARTERSACGAACYTFKMPADALAGEACSIASVSVGLVGDRYLECGALVTFLVSDSATPPSFAQLVADGDEFGPYLVPDTTIERVNDRPDTTETLTWSPATAPAPAYIHVLIRVADYLAARGAWHEGGAMLAPDSVSVTFLRDVAPDASTEGGYPLYWHKPYLPFRMSWDCSAVFAIEVPNPMWSTFWPATTTWSASAQQLRELLSGIRMPGAISVKDVSNNSLFFGHMVIAYGEGASAIGSRPPASGVEGTIWAGYKLHSFTFPSSQNNGATLKLPVQHVASAIYPVTGVFPQRFHALRAPAATVNSHISIRLLAYRVASRPPLSKKAGYFGAEVSTMSQMFRPYPIPDFLDCEHLLAGQGESMAFLASYGSSGDIAPYYPSGDPPTPLPYYPIPISLLGAWTITDNIAAGTQFRLTTPLEVDGYAGLLLLAVPCDYSRGGAPASTDNVYCDWPLSGWSLVE